ncbi:tRNA (guanine(10)-N(2))-dimethyltransferase [Thermofilum pendens]|uniref:tRNA (guanine(26)-N(2))-dimethyltransferase n=1 Tax=Thermofilum pendens (strain DSM 2475 / Hrk 5) TaxID=368408 RepID=A1RX58_THEPD|nr:tRNA (guanine(10)-N(2))-dimethyltransferase [Thermofilum pendens]ABL77788.1 tRNA (guanine-N(2)-)-methyltransferase [Thermofilum pendens Hrk 5]
MEDLSTVSEGRGVFKVYPPEKYRDPAWAPVFYNPRMRCSRDISSVIVGAYAELLGRGGLVVVDAFSATGIRGIRYALENEGVGRVILNDINPRAVEIIRQNVDLNGVSDIVEVRREDASSLLASLSGVDIVDLDPFGSPAEYVDPALRCLKHKGLLCVTATDLPPLLGKYPKTCVRKYFSKSIETEFSRELAVRILLYFIAREAAKLGRTIVPLYSYYMEHHVRVCVLVLKTESRYGGLTDSIGFVKYNPTSLERAAVPLFDFYREERSDNWVVGGPLWVKEIFQRTFADAVGRAYSSKLKAHGLCGKGWRVVSTILEEVSRPPFYFTTEKFASTYRLKEEKSVVEVLEVLRARGFEGSRTHFDPKGFRTSASIGEILEAIAKS